MPNLTAPLPRRTGDLQEDFNELYRCYIALVDEMKSLLCNLDAGNVTEAGSVKVQNLDATQAKIKDAQIASLTADKLTAGTIDTGQITVTGKTENGGTMIMTGDRIVFEDGDGNKRIYIGSERNDETGVYQVKFRVQNAGGTQGVFMDEEGKISLTGNIETTQNCVIQGQLRVGNKTSATDNKGIVFYGKSFNAKDESDGYCGGIYPYVIGYSDDAPIYAGMLMDKDLYINRGGTIYRVAVEPLTS